jgi:HlyD family secretion protein
MRITRIPVLTWVKRSAVAAILVAIAGAIAWSLLPKPVPVEAVTIARGPLTVTVDEDGRARVDDRYTIAAPVAGTLARIALEPGDTVSAGAVVARIVPVPPPLLDARTRREIEGQVAVARARQAQTLSVIERAEANRKYQDSELARVRGLVERGVLAGAELERQELTTSVATREVESARFGAAIAADELATARALVARLDQPGRDGDEVIVRSPVSGRVLRVIAQSEGVVAPATPLVEIGDPARLEVVVDVLTADAAAIEPATPVELTGWGGPPLRAAVRLVEPSAVTRVSALGVEEQRVAVVVDLLDPPAQWRGLGDGWRVDARIAVWSAPDVVQVPLGALFRDEESWAVYILRDGRARLRRIELGRRGQAHAEVRGGLVPGERVVFHPSERVTDGARVVVD